jgi:hypothetical protein
LADYPDLLTQIRDAARVDDREPSKWLRRKIVQFSKCLMPGDAKPILFSALAVKEPERHPPANPPGERATTGL